VTLTKIGTSAWCTTLNVVEVGFDDEPEVFSISTRAKSCTPGKTHRPLESLRPSRTVVTQPDQGIFLKTSFE